MEWKSTYKKATAFALAVLFVLSPAQLVSPFNQIVQAAENRVEFKEQVGEGKYEYNVNTQVVAGYNVEMRTDLPDYTGKWSYTNPPYGFFRDGAPLNGVSANLTGDAGNPQRISVKSAPLENEGGSDWLSYTVVPNMQVNMTKGIGEFLYQKVVDSGPVQEEKVAISVESASGLAIIAPSSITFETVDGQTDTGLTFKNVSAATGPWAGLYNGKSVLVRNQNGNSFEIIVDNSLVLNIASPMKIPAGAKFTITYTFGKMPELTLTAVTPDRAMGDVEKNMEKLTEPSETGERLPYMQFTNQSDYQYGVTSSFYLLNEFYKYNAPMKIDWSLEDPDADGEYVKIIPQQGKNQVIAQVNSSISETNHPVTLVAKIGFRHGAAAGESKIVKVPIVIQGSGTRPRMEINKLYHGINFNNTQQITEKPANNTFPLQLEVYDGQKKHVASKEEQERFPPFKVQSTMRFGISQGRATHAMITTTAESTGQVKFYQDAQNTGRVVTTQGIKVDNLLSSELEQETLAYFVGEKEGNVSLKIEFFNGNNAVNSFIYHIEVVDHSPKSDATLKQLDMTGILDPNATDEQKEAFRETYVPNGKIEYGFSSEGITYNLTLPAVVEKITLRPVYNYLSIYESAQHKQDVKIFVNGKDSGIPPVPSGDTSIPINLAPNAVTALEVATMAEDGTKKTYKINVTRASKSTDSSLQGIAITRMDADKTPVSFTPAFNAGNYRYTASVPYGVDKVNVKAIAAGLWGARPTITSDGPQRNLISRIFENASDKEILLTYDDSDINNIKNVTNVTIEVKAEDANTPPQQYMIAITREHPSDDRTLNVLNLFRDKEMTQVKVNGTLEYRDLAARIPYSTNSLRLELKPTDVKSLKVRVEASAGNNRSQTKQFINKETPLIFNFDGLGQGSNPDSELNEITFTIWVTAESGRETDPPYVLTVERDEADSDSRLNSLTVVNEADNVAVPGFSFIQTRRDYEFSVPYTTEAVIVTPVAKSKLAKVYVDGKLITENVPSRTVKLPASSTTTINVLVVPESGANDPPYTLKITRTAPAKEARLINLVVNGGTDQKPTPFVPSTTTYSWSIPEGTRNFTVTATAVDPLATITVNGVTAPNGGASAPIVTTQANNTVQVVVTAQDGVTKKTYTLRITDYNFIKKSDNAFLASLGTNYGQLAPKFNRTVMEYEVYVKPTAMSLGITPKPANSKAKLEVKAGSLNVGEYNGMYTASMLEDELTFTIKVTSEDGKHTNTYTLYVYRNDEEKQGIFNPIVPDMVDFESSDPIIVDIMNYPVVDAGVFNIMKTEYPDKTILFKGNDYTLEMKGSDLDTLVPHTASYDLAFSFTTPDQKEIEDVLYDMGARNDRLDPVYLHFDHHGALPAPMRLTVSLGKEYSNKTLYWNYYNSERDRIDYYGYVKTNAKGTYSVPVDQLGTYLITTEKIAGAENKSGLDYSSAPWLEEIGANEETVGAKYNPETGAEGPK